jgi:hypothetical protein
MVTGRGVNAAYTPNIKLQGKVDGISDRLIRVETRLDTYVEIAQGQKQLEKK